MIEVVPATREYLSPWAEMRLALWPWDNEAAHAAKAAELYLGGNPDMQAYLAFTIDGAIAGFSEASLRRDFVEGCESSPVAFLEGIYVRPEHRHRGVARALTSAVEDWGKTLGCSEFASNALLDNTDSHAFHAAVGFAETERVVFFKKLLS